MLETQTNASLGSLDDAMANLKPSNTQGSAAGKPPLSPNSTSKPPLSPKSPTHSSICGKEQGPKDSEEGVGGSSFIMDWIERLNVDHLDFARKLLTTPDRSYEKKSRAGQNSAETGTGSPPHKLEQPTKAQETTTTSLKKFEIESTNKSSIRKLHISPTISFRKRSIMIGNGWNAKGLEKARLGKWEEALSCWENALEIREQIMGETHPDVANTWNNIGIALGKLDRFCEALQALQKALNLRIEHHGTEKHTEIAATYHNMANIHQQAGFYKEALKFLEKSMNISQLLLGKKDIQVARTRMAMGHAYFDAQDYQQALRAYREALGIMKLCHRAGDDTGLDCSLEMDQCTLDIAETKELLTKNETH